METSDFNYSESPSSALLERLKNLRKWQDEQRKELASSIHERSLLDENSCRQSHSKVSTQELQDIHKTANVTGNENAKVVVDTSPVGLHQQSAHNRLSPSCESVLSKKRLESDEISPSSRSYVGSDSLLFNKFIDVNHKDNPMHHPASSKDDTNEIVMDAKEQLKRGITEDDLLEDTDMNLKANPSKLNLQYMFDPIKKVQGLSSFMTRHLVDRPAIKVDDSQPVDEMLPLQTRPKFTYLKKGQGTSRFGMKSFRIRYKADVNKHKVDTKQGSILLNVNQAPLLDSRQPSLSNIKVMKVANMPIKRLQLQKKPSMASVGENVVQLAGQGPVQYSELESPKLLGADSGRSREVSRNLEHEKIVHKEREELSAFEKLEELAEDSSFSSNSSTVVGLLQRGLQSSFSTPVRSSPSPLFSTPVSGLVDSRQSNVCIRLTGRIDESEIPVGRDSTQHNVLPLVNVSQILEQLKKIVKLDGNQQFRISQEVKQLVESFAEDNALLTSDSILLFENYLKELKVDNPTSTPAECLEESTPKHRVHFQDEGVEVLEYEISDEENTLTETPSIADDTDLVTTSDLEILAQLNYNKAARFMGVKQHHQSFDEGADAGESESNLQQDAVPITEVVKPDSSCPALDVLEFSPPRRPQNSASHYIWSIFGHKNSREMNKEPKKLCNKEKEMGERGSFKPTHSQAKEQCLKNTHESKILKKGKVETSSDVETHKTLLLAKVCELEKEIEMYKKENSRLKNLKQFLEKERQQFEQERKAFHVEMVNEKKKFRDFVDSERNTLWKEKQVAKHQSPTVTTVREQSLEVVYLKEQLHDVQEEAKKDKSLHQFAVRKLNEKVKSLEEEVKSLKEKNIASQKLQKENLNLKHELDRAKVSKKHGTNNRFGANLASKQILKTKTATISTINKSLDNMVVGSVKFKESSSGTSKLQRTKSSEKNFRPNPTFHPMPSDNTERCDVDNSPSKRVEKHSTNLNPSLQYLNSDGKVQNMDMDYVNESPKSQESADARNSSASLKDLYGNQVDTHNTKEKGRYPDRMDNFIVSPQGSQPSAEVLMDTRASNGGFSIDFTELSQDDGTREIIFANGNKKEILPDGSVIFSYYNGDRKEVYEDRTMYVYGTDQTSHTTFRDGREFFQFPGGQTETRFTDGSSEIVFPDKTRKMMLPDGSEVCNTEDGTIIRTNSNGIRVIEFVSGQREVHTPEQKRREYPDGTVKILHPDGRTETRYRNGRVRVKDKEGHILSDTHQSVQ